jgi:hypothetical protein
MRFKINRQGPVELKLKTSWRDGATHHVMSPLEFMHWQRQPTASRTRSANALGLGQIIEAGVQLRLAPLKSRLTVCKQCTPDCAGTVTGFFGTLKLGTNYSNGSTTNPAKI